MKTIVKKKAGFTLVEVMIAMVVFSLLMVLVANSMNISTRLSMRSNEELNQKISEFVRLEKLTRVISAIQPYGIALERNPKLRVFFQGTKSTMIFVSNIGFFEQGPVIVQLRLQQANSGLEIVFAEKPLSQTMLTNITQLNTIQWEWFTLKQNLISAELSYYGYESLDDLKLDRSIGTNKEPKTKWFEQYQGESTKLIPQKVALSWQQINQRETIDFQLEMPVVINDASRFSLIDFER